MITRFLSAFQPVDLMDLMIKFAAILALSGQSYYLRVLLFKFFYTCTCEFLVLGNLFNKIFGVMPALESMILT